MPYPDLPKNRIILNGEYDICKMFQIALLDGYKLSPPEPKLYTVDIPGGDGVIDLTEAMTGNVVYNNRSQEFTFACIYPEDWEWVKTELSNFVHGKAFDYELTFDPGYTYHGRFMLEEYAHHAFPDGKLGTFKLKIDADPYKSKGIKTYKLNATGGKMFRLESGRRPVHPVVECAQPFRVTWNRKTQHLGAGAAYRLNDVLFQDGWNDIYINSYEVWNTTWEEVAEGAESELTWQSAMGQKWRWDDIQRIGRGTQTEIPRAWSDLREIRWEEYADQNWDEVNYKVENAPDTIVYLQYEWEDL